MTADGLPRLAPNLPTCNIMVGEGGGGYYLGVSSGRRVNIRGYHRFRLVRGVIKLDLHNISLGHIF